MEELTTKQDSLVAALATLERAVILIHENKQPDFADVLRDSLIQRFEYTIDCFWKFLKFYLLEKLGISLDVNTPRVILRESMNARAITEEEFRILLEAIANRNLTSHTYREELAESVSKGIPDYYTTMNVIVQRLKL